MPIINLPIEAVGIGAATLDDFWLVDDFSHAERVAPALDHHRMGGGPVATALCVLAHLGHTCALVDRGGDDSTGVTIRKALLHAGVSTAIMQTTAGAASACAVVLVRKRDGARQIVYQPASSGEPSWGAQEKALLSQARMLHLNGRHEAAAYQAIADARESKVAISFDGGAGRYRDSLRDMVTASHIRIVALDFARQWSGCDDLAGMMRALKQGSAHVVVITDGVRGSYVALPGGEVFHQCAYTASPLVDTTGCGDVYHGAFLHGWLLGWEGPRCADFASKMAARNAEGLGGRFCLMDQAPG